MLPLDHIGIAVTDLDSSLRQYTRDFGFTVKHREIVSSQQVEIVFLELANTMIELLAATAKESPIQKFLDKRGAGLHHVCYRVDDIKGELERFEKLGYRLIDSTPRPGAHNTMIAFIHPTAVGGVLTELCQYS